MLDIARLPLSANVNPLNLNCGKTEKVVLILPEMERGLLWDFLTGNAQPGEGKIEWAEESEQVFWPNKEEEWENNPVNKVLTRYVADLLKSLRKYEQLNLKMARHFSPAQLGGYIQEMEALEQFIQNYEAWELEQEIKEWKNLFNLPDGETPMKTLNKTTQKLVGLTSVLIVPKCYRVLENPFAFVKENPDAVAQKLDQSETGWLLLKTKNEELPLSNIDKKLDFG